jgi:hypothetical protein
MKIKIIVFVIAFALQKSEFGWFMIGMPDGLKGWDDHLDYGWKQKLKQISSITVDFSYDIINKILKW